MDPQEILAHLALFEKNAWSVDTLWTKLSEAGVNPDDFDPDVERDRLDQQAMLNVPPEPIVPAPLEEE